MIGALHDFGKYTTYFQKYLIGKMDKGYKQKFKRHAYISALFASYCGKENNLPENYQLYIYFSIKHHHGNLCNFDEDIGREYYNEVLDPNMNENIKILEAQLCDISKQKTDILSDMNLIVEAGQEYGLKINVLDKFINSYKDYFDYLVSINEKLIKYDMFDKLNLDANELMLLYSSLIDSDKRSAASIESYHRQDIKSEYIEKYKEINFTANTLPIHRLRNSLYIDVKKNIESVDLKLHFFTITAPTGAGKTIAGMLAASFLAEKLQTIYKKQFRIIYTMPFTTLIDQNYLVIDKILKENIDNYENDRERYLIKHHHLSISNQIVNSNELPLDQSLMLVESWDSEIIVSTFVQLFSAIAGFKNKNLKKYHNIYNSVIILDEIQSIEVEKWEEIKFLLKMAASKMNVYIILMTATQPEIIPEAIELGGNVKKRFQSLNRVDMHPNLTQLTPEDIIEEYINKISDSSILFMFNTIKSSIRAYDYLKKIKERQWKIYYLSTNIIPNQRTKRIEEIIRSLKDNKKTIVVSTQIFEAGIDISFHAVVRDIAPIDSIIQSSGRVNRNMTMQKGNIYIVNCSPENGHDGYYSRKVYGKIHTDTTLEILKQKNAVIQESEYLDLIKEYYNKVKININSTTNLDDAFKNLRFSEDKKNFCISDFSIISDSDKYISLYIAIDRSSEELLENYINRNKTSENYNSEEAIKLKKDIYKYIISVRPNQLSNINYEKLNKFANFYVIRNSYVSQYYDNETGLKENGEGIIEI